MKYFAIVPAFLAVLAAADQVITLGEYTDDVPSWSANEDITLKWKRGFFNPYINEDYTPDTFQIELAAFNNTPISIGIDQLGHPVPKYEVSTVVDIDTEASVDALTYTFKPELINGWQGEGYWYYISTNWVGTNGVGEGFGTGHFFLSE
ncbi:hypothetical protein F4808DRAFT_337835 [Astrocystis sublimbata]|nr:hypothetical protein F4808DRAFT_337835 [Astrocystis sublimbata]